MKQLRKAAEKRALQRDAEELVYRAFLSAVVGASSEKELLSRLWDRLELALELASEPEALSEVIGVKFRKRRTK